MLYMFRALSPPIIRSSKLYSNKEYCITLHLIGCTLKSTLTMHAHKNVKFINAKQAKEYINIGTSKENCTKYISDAVCTVLSS
jgi:hypothetical protein